jgi:hypothetical protein
VEEFLGVFYTVLRRWFPALDGTAVWPAFVEESKVWIPMAGLSSANDLLTIVLNVCRTLPQAVQVKVFLDWGAWEGVSGTFEAEAKLRAMTCWSEMLPREVAWSHIFNSIMRTNERWATGRRAILVTYPNGNQRRMYIQNPAVFSVFTEESNP